MNEFGKGLDITSDEGLTIEIRLLYIKGKKFTEKTTIVRVSTIGKIFAERVEATLKMSNAAVRSSSAGAIGFGHKSDERIKLTFCKSLEFLGTYCTEFADGTTPVSPQHRQLIA